jgi:DNA-binding Lrp family transcriptional regulator
MLKSEFVEIDDQYKGFREIAKQLDPTNIQILTAMWKYGPRNLLEISRRTKLPFTSVYHRVAQLESKSKAAGNPRESSDLAIAYLIPQVAKLSLVRVTVMLTAVPGRESEVTEALRAPNLWRMIDRCEGTFTHVSVHLVPVKYLQEFRSYAQSLLSKNLATNAEISLTGDYVPNFPDFASYNPVAATWNFDWENWLATQTSDQETTAINDPPNYPLTVDKKDLIIIAELEQNARKSFVDIASVVGTTPQGVKYHYDKKLVPSGIVRYFQLRVLPYPLEIAAYHQVTVEFNSKNDLDRFYSLMPRLFFIIGMAKVLRQNMLVMHTHMLDSQLSKMFTFLSQLAKTGSLRTYSSIRIDPNLRRTQTVSYELFDDDDGWIVRFKDVQH